MKLRVLLLAGLLVETAKALPAQVVRVRARPLYSIPGTLTVSATPASINFTLVNGGVATGSMPISITSGYLLSLGATVQLWAYFSTASALTESAGPGIIPVANMWGQCSTGLPTSYTAFTQTSPFSGATALEIYSQAAGIGLLVSRTDVLNMKVDLSTVIATLPADTYTGTLLLEAYAF